MFTPEQCKRRLFKIGLQLGVSPTLISTRLLSKDDKQDMLAELIDDDSLVTAVKCWMAAGMPDYANGHTSPYKAPKPESDRLSLVMAKNVPHRRFKR